MRSMVLRVALLAVPFVAVAACAGDPEDASQSADPIVANRVDRVPGARACPSKHRLGVGRVVANGGGHDDADDDDDQGEGCNPTTGSGGGPGPQPAPGSTLASRDYGANVTVDDVRADAAGNVLFSGTYTGAAPWPAMPDAGAGTRGYLAKIDAQGNVLFAHALDAGWHGALADDAGHFLFATSVSGTADFGEGPMTNGSYVALYDDHGVRLWSKFLKGDSDAVVTGAAMGCDRVYVVGWSHGGVDGGGGAFQPSQARAAFVLEYDIDGNYLDEVDMSMASGFTRRIAVDAACRPTITGKTGADSPSTPTVEGKPYAKVTGADNDTDWVARFDAALDPVWFEGFDNGGGPVIAPNAAGSVLVAGHWIDAFQLDGVTYGGADGGSYIVVIDEAGDHVWSRVATSSPATSPIEWNRVEEAGLDDDGYGYVSGSLVSGPGTDTYVRAFGPTGALLWTHVESNAGLDAVRSISTGQHAVATVGGARDGSGWIGAFAR